MSDYINYTASELAQEDSFIHWVRGSDVSASQFWENWLAEHPERAEVVESARQLVERLHFEEQAPPTQRIEALWSRIEKASFESSDEEPKINKPTRIRRLYGVASAVAACALLLIVLQWRNSMAWETVETAPGDQLVYLLPDGSIVELNVETTLRFKPNSYTEDRMVEVNGEAFFYVQKGNPFEVITDLGKVEVLGTTFNVLSKEGTFEVDCFTGRVAVSVENGRSREELSPGQGTKFNGGDGNLVDYSFVKGQKATWREGLIYYDNAPFSQVFNNLEKIFEITVIAPAELKEKPVKGFFKTQDLEEAIQAIAWPERLQYQMRGDTVIFKTEE